MNIVTILARILLGLAFLVFGLNGFLHFIPMGKPPGGLAGDFTRALFVSHYFYVVSSLQIAGGLLLLVGRFVPLGLTLLGPVAANILLFHIFLAPEGLPIAIVVTVLELFLIARYHRAFAGIFQP